MEDKMTYKKDINQLKKDRERTTSKNNNPRVREPLEGIRKHKLLTAELRQKIPPLYAQEEKGKDKMVYVKFFSPYSHYTWYVTEFDGKDTFFGFVEGDFPEWGYFSYRELVTLEKNGLPLVERDRFFKPKKFSKIEIRR